MRKESKSKLSSSQIRNRPNKNALGFYFTDERRRKSTNKQRITFHSDLNSEEKMFKNRLNLYGTGDLLARREGLYPYMKKVKIAHPTDAGYYKEINIITDAGKKRLATLKKFKDNGTAFWYYMSEPILLP